MSAMPDDDPIAVTGPVPAQSEFDSPEVVEELDLSDGPAPAVDLLHTYVRQIGDGALLTGPRSSSSPGARTAATTMPSTGWSRPTCAS